MHHQWDGCPSAHLSQTHREEFQRICQHLEVSFGACCSSWKCDLKPELIQWRNGNISESNMEEEPTDGTRFCHLHSHHTSLLSCQGLLQAKVHHPYGPEAKRAKMHPQWHLHLKWADTMNPLTMEVQTRSNKPSWHNNKSSKCRCSHRWCQEVSPSKNKTKKRDMNGCLGEDRKDGGTGVWQELDRSRSLSKVVSLRRLVAKRWDFANASDGHGRAVREGASNLVKVRWIFDLCLCPLSFYIFLPPPPHIALLLGTALPESQRWWICTNDVWSPLWEGSDSWPSCSGWAWLGWDAARLPKWAINQNHSCDKSLTKPWSIH